ncbi:hemopexin repeat-containing protein [Serinicoccus kebangsaanensis]|uniref:hemopexin repeat-containing protein n=1 Tax=Serinicoccus kebangsaanensis TaxID=2602069 RepID=UPI00124F2B8B|nr:hemopexin repeat-containing protein [Serinicoccus kebangsaanensis]
MTRNQRLINEVSVGLVIVDGPGELQIPTAELLSIAGQVQSGLEDLAGIEPQAKVSWRWATRVVHLEESIFPDAPWRGMPKSFYTEPLDAALWRESNDRTYLFQGDRYLRMTGSVTDAGYPRPIAGNWKGLPSDFTDGIDAAFWHKQRDKIYLFKGDRYARLTETEMDPGYPRPIAGNWQGLPDDFAEGIDAVFMHHQTNKIYMFKGDRYVRLTGTEMDGGYPQPIAPNFGGLPEHFETGIQAALWRGDIDKIYFFGRAERNRLNEYVRYSPGGFSAPDAGYPKYVGGLDKGETEALWRDAAQAELGVGAGRPGFEAYADQLQQQHGTASSIVCFVTSYPVYWPGYASTPKWVMAWSPTWSSFSTVVAHETGHLFGAPDEYEASNCSCSSVAGRFTRAVNGNCTPCAGSITMDDGYPGSIAGPWGGMPAAFASGIDAAVYRHDNNKVYFFKGSEYVRLTGTTVDAGYPRPIAGNWHGLPASFTSGIDAAVWRPANNKLYLFKGSQYARMSGSTMDAGYPRAIAGAWKGIPSSFEQGIDAAVWRPSNDKIYLFKGSQYVRLTDTTMDEGYPAPIAGNWHGLPASFSSGLDAALWHEERGHIYLFSGSQYVRMTNGTPCLMRSSGPVVCGYTRSHWGWSAFLERVDAAVHRGDNDKIYLFSGAHYARYSQAGTMDEGYPTTIAGNWKGLPSRFTRNLDAALYRESNGKTYLFKGSEYVRMTGAEMDAGYPAPIKGNWKGLPADFEEGIDAALWRMSNDKIYFFKGDRYVRLTEAQADPGFPQPISPNWTGLPAHYANGIDAALMRRDTNQIYLFNGRTYLRYSNVANGPDAGFPAWINGNWMPFPRT